MLADNLDRIVLRMSKELVRALREASRNELFSLLPALRKGEPAPTGRKPVAKAKPAGRKPGRPPGSTNKAAPKSKRGAGSLMRQILNLLKVRREGFRSEEIQRRLKADPDELRDNLARLFAAERIERHGQARGTRYSLPSIDGPESSSPDAVNLSTEAFSEPVEVAPPVEVTDNMIDEVRKLLADSAHPVLLQELQSQLPFKHDTLKAVLEHMEREGYIERSRSGPNKKFSLSSHAPKKSQAEAGVRVRKRSAGEHSGDTEAQSPSPPAVDSPAPAVASAPAAAPSAPAAAPAADLEKGGH